MSLAALVADAKHFYAAGLDCGDGLLPPADKVDLDTLQHGLALPLPAELRELYQIHGGQEYRSPGTTGLFGQHRLLTPDEAANHHRMYLAHCLLDPPPAFPPPAGDWGYWVPQLIPFASWDAYDLCVHAETGEVWEFIPDTGLIRHRPSIRAVLNEVIDAVRAGRPAELGAMRGVG